MIINNNVEIVLGTLNTTHYRNLGYDGKPGDTILVEEKDLTPGSGVIVEHKCDLCGRNFTKPYRLRKYKTK